MAFKSKKQQRFLFSQKPSVAYSKKYTSPTTDKAKEAASRSYSRKIQRN